MQCKPYATKANKIKSDKVTDARKITPMLKKICNTQIPHKSIGQVQILAAKIVPSSLIAKTSAQPRAQNFLTLQKNNSKSGGFGISANKSAHQLSHYSLVQICLAKSRRSNNINNIHSEESLSMNLGIFPGRPPGFVHTKDPVFIPGDSIARQE